MAFLVPGPFRFALENQTGHRVLPGVFTAGEKLDTLLGRRRCFPTAKDLLTGLAFRARHCADTSTSTRA